MNRRRPIPALLLALALLAPAGRLLAHEPQTEEPAGSEDALARSPEEWAEWAERWQRWGEEFGERWGEEFGERWGENLGERWGEEHADHWRRWAEELGERGEEWEELGQEIAREVEKALAEVDWDAIGLAMEESMSSLEAIDWERMGAELERDLEELERRLEEDGPEPDGPF